MIIQAFHLTKVHSSGVKVLDDAYFYAGSGSFVVVIGESKTGKSTFLRMLGGEEKPTSGTLRVDHLDLYTLPPGEKQEWLSDVGMVFPDLKLFADKTVEENILFALRVKGAGTGIDEKKEAITRLLTNAGLGPKAKALSGDLSSGELRMVLSLRAMIFRPRLLLADDPFQGLDEKAVAVLFHLLSELHKTGATIVLSTQQLAFIEEARRSELGATIRWVRLQDGKLLPLEGAAP